MMMMLTAGTVEIRVAGEVVVRLRRVVGEIVEAAAAGIAAAIDEEAAVVVVGDGREAGRLVVR